MQLSKSKFGSFTVYHRTKKEFEDLLRDIDESKYQFTNTSNQPFIIDAGAHIGMSMLYFKWCFPEARIICFEPSPETFILLQKNIEVNNLKNVIAIPAALSDTIGTATLYGKMGWEESDTRGNSITEAWGAWQSQQSCQVNTVKLSSYIQETVDFLKLDIEGAEMIVLRDIMQKLSLIKQIFIETHITLNSDFCLTEIKSILKNNNFNIRDEITNCLYEYVPDDIKESARNLDAQLTTFKAENLSFIPHEKQNFTLKNIGHESPYILSESQIVAHD